MCWLHPKQSEVCCRSIDRGGEKKKKKLNKNNLCFCWSELNGPKLQWKNKQEASLWLIFLCAIVLMWWCENHIHVVGYFCSLKTDREDRELRHVCDENLTLSVAQISADLGLSHGPDAAIAHEGVAPKSPFLCLAHITLKVFLEKDLQSNFRVVQMSTARIVNLKHNWYIKHL